MTPPIPVRRTIRTVPNETGRRFAGAGPARWVKFPISPIVGSGDDGPRAPVSTTTASSEGGYGRGMGDVSKEGAN